MIGKLQCVVLDFPDGPGLARFYQALLGGEVNQADPRWAVDDDFSTLHTGSGLVFAFQREAGAWQRKRELSGARRSAGAMFSAACFAC